MSKKRPFSQTLRILFEDFENTKRTKEDKTRLKRRLLMTTLNFKKAKQFYMAENTTMLQEIFLNQKPTKKR